MAFQKDSPKIAFDIEVYKGWWCVVWQNVLETEQHVITSEDKDILKQLNDLRSVKLLIGFNIKNYDLKILKGILKGLGTDRLYQLSKNIIDNNEDCFNSYSYWNDFIFQDLFDD